MVEYDSAGRVMNMAQRTRLAAIRSELEAMSKKSSLTQADYDRTLELETQIRLIDDGPDSGVREYGSEPIFLQEARMKNQRRNGQFQNGRGTGEGYTRTPDKQEAIFCRVVRTADPMAVAELRASNDTDMNIGTAADGGDLVPTAHYQDIIAKMRPQALHERLGVRQFGGIGTTLNVPIDNEGDSGAFVATNEASAFDRDAPAMSKVAMTYVKYTKKIELSVELIQDEDSNLLSFLSSYVADGMAATLNSLLVTEVLSGGTAGLTFDAAAAIGAAEVPELLYKLSAEYAEGSNVSWLANRSTEGYLRGLVGDSFQYAPTPSGRPGARSELFGLPLATNSNVPAIGAGNKSLLIGNWNFMGLRIAPGLQFLSDPYTLGHLGQTRLLYHFRAVFKTLQATAFQYGTHPTSS